MKVHCAADLLVSVSQLKPHPKNVNAHPAEQIVRLAKILEYQGWRYPIKVSKRSGYVTSGHGRLLAAKHLGWTEVPVDFQDYESDEQEYADIVSDNAIAEWSDLDLSAINTDIVDLGPDFDIDLLGIKDFVVEPADRLEPQCDEDEVPEALPEPKVVRGEVFILGKHRLMCGDSTAITDVERLMDGKKAQTFFTDPPYGDNVGGLSPKAAHEREPGKGLVKRVCFIANDKKIDWLVEVFNLVPGFLEEENTKMVFFKWDRLEQIKSMAAAFGEPSALCVWDRVRKASAFFRFQPQHEFCFHWGNQSDKKEPSDLSNVWRVPKELELKELHPTVKPMSIIEPALRVTTSKNKRVLDLFGGSGTTLIAAEASDRIAHLMELDPRYCGVILDRWQKYTGKKAHREDGVAWDEIKAQ